MGSEMRWNEDQEETWNGNRITPGMGTLALNFTMRYGLRLHTELKQPDIRARIAGGSKFRLNEWIGIDRGQKDH